MRIRPPSDHIEKNSLWVWFWKYTSLIYAYSATIKKTKMLLEFEIQHGCILGTQDCHLSISHSISVINNHYSESKFSDDHTKIVIVIPHAEAL